LQIRDEDKDKRGNCGYIGKSESCGNGNVLYLDGVKQTIFVDCFFLSFFKMSLPKY
jgi:hypothetical protein